MTYLLAGVAPVAFLLGLVVNAQILRVQRGQDAVATLKNKKDLIIVVLVNVAFITLLERKF